MAITFINAETAASAAAVSITVNKPTNTAEGDLMVAHIFIENTSDLINSVPDGWTNIINASAGARAIREYVYWKIAGASEPSSYQWGMSSSHEIIGQIATFRGVDQTSPIGNKNTSTSTASGQPTAPGINIQTANNWAVFLAGNAYGTTYTPPSGYDERADTQTGTSNSNISATVATKEYTAAGATGDIAATAVNTDYYVASLVELKQYIAITPISVSDSGTGADAIAGVSATLALSDSGAGSDSIASLLAALSVQDVATGSDIVADILALLTASDSGAGSESIAISILWQGAVSDSGTGSDLVSILVAASLADVGAGSDAISILWQGAVSDSGTGSDLVSILAAASLADVGAGADEIGLLIQVNLADSGSGVDSVSIADPSSPYKEISDSGAGSEWVDIVRKGETRGYPKPVDQRDLFEILRWSLPAVWPEAGKSEPPDDIRFDGLLAYADGTNWDPGSGKGYYRWDGPTSSWVPLGGGGGSGDMLKSVYDTDNDGRVDTSESVSDGTYTSTAAEVRQAVDGRPIYDSDFKCLTTTG